MRQSYHGMLEKKLDEIATMSNELIKRGSNDSTATSLLDCMREFLREDELAPFKTTAWKESRRWENETILEPNDWQKMQNELSPSSVDLPDEEKIAHRMGWGYWNMPSSRIPTPSSDHIRFRQRLDKPIPVQDSMSKLSIGPPPALPLERDLESQLEYVPMVEVVRAEDREAVVNANRRDERRNDGGMSMEIEFQLVSLRSFRTSAYVVVDDLNEFTNLPTVVISFINLDFWSDCFLNYTEE